MKHIISTGPMKSQIVDEPMPTITDDQLLIKTKYVGVCRSEHDDWKVAEAGQQFGHEPMGYVAEVGKNVKGFAVGDRVSGLWGGSLPGSGGMVEYGVATPGKDVVVKLPDCLSDEEAILEPLACIASAVSKVKKGVPGDKIAVVGTGYMGCGAISLLKACGAYVVAVDIRPESREWAKRYGADEVYTPEEAWEKFEAHMDPSEGFLGFDAVMEWGETNESLDLAIHMTKMCGQLCIGAYHTGGKRLVDVQRLNVMAIDCLSTHPRQLELSRSGAENAARMLASGEWKFRNVPTKIYPRTMFDQAQADLEVKYGKFVKAAVDMTMEDGEPYIIGE
jgi:threonine dehydrogenase-like Zn-dependent dehydrogenase